MLHTRLQTVLFTFSGQCGYVRHGASDCNYRQTIGSIGSDGSSNHENCMEWCNARSNCGGFSKHSSYIICRFRASGCGNTIFTSRYSTLYVKQGKASRLKSNLFEINAICRNVLQENMEVTRTSTDMQCL